MLLMWSQWFSGCNDRQTSCLPKNQKEFPRDVIIQGSLCEYAQLSVSFRFKSELKIQNMLKIENDASTSSLRPKQIEWGKFSVCLNNGWVMPRSFWKVTCDYGKCLYLILLLGPVVTELWVGRVSACEMHPQATPLQLGTFQMCAGSLWLPGC